MKKRFLVDYQEVVVLRFSAEVFLDEALLSDSPLEMSERLCSEIEAYRTEGVTPQDQTTVHTVVQSWEAKAE